eukprot:29508-Amphidinium_carterae.1
MQEARQDHAPADLANPHAYSLPASERVQVAAFAYSNRLRVNREPRLLHYALRSPKLGCSKHAILAKVPETCFFNSASSKGSRKASHHRPPSAILIILATSVCSRMANANSFLRPSPIAKATEVAHCSYCLRDTSVIPSSIATLGCIGPDSIDLQACMSEAVSSASVVDCSLHNTRHL